MKKVLLGIVVLAGVVLAGCSTQSSQFSQEQLGEFASCVAETGMVLYATERCPHCQNQKKMFGAAVENLEIIDCDAQRVRCEVAGVQGFPTWIMGEQRFEGVQPLEQISAATGCPLVASAE